MGVFSGFCDCEGAGAGDEKDSSGVVTHFCVTSDPQSSHSAGANL